MPTVSMLYAYPVTVDSAEFLNNTGRDLEAEIEGDDGVRKVVNFLNNLHRIVYDDLIYTVGPRRIKELIIAAHKDELQADIKKALFVQGEYLLDNTDISLWNGTVMAANGTVSVTDSTPILQKIVSPAVIDILRNTNPNILYMGE